MLQMSWRNLEKSPSQLFLGLETQDVKSLTSPSELVNLQPGNSRGTQLLRVTSTDSTQESAGQPGRLL